MNNLENKIVLPDNIFDVIIKIQKKIPSVVFGGSIALNAVEKLNVNVVN